MKIEFPYSYKMVNVNELFIDSSYQRDLKGRGKKIASNLRPELFDPLVVSKREVGYAVVDGQARTGAARTLGIDKVPCLVHLGLKIQQEARMFREIQELRKALRPYEVYRSELVEGSPTALSVENLSKEFGYEVIDSGKGPNHITAVVAAKKVVGKGGEDGLRGVFTITRGCWDGVQGSVSSEMLLTLDYLLRSKNRTPEKLAESIKKHSLTPELIRVKAGALSQGIGRGGGSFIYSVDAIEFVIDGAITPKDRS